MTTRNPPLREVREKELMAATRALFDERGTLDVPIEEIAQAVGLARGLIYRQFSSKEELFVLTVSSYLDELAALNLSAVESGRDPMGKLALCVEAYTGYCRRYPAFLDGQALLTQQHARELHGFVSEAVWLRLGRAMVSCLGPLSDVLSEGARDGVFAVEDADFTASFLWTQWMGAMHLARVRVGVRRDAAGGPDLFLVDPDVLVRACVRSSLATVGAPAAD